MGWCPCRGGSSAGMETIIKPKYYQTSYNINGTMTGGTKTNKNTISSTLKRET